MMIDEHAKQSTDNDSGQNMARKEDSHTTLLHSSNPAFHTLSAMGIKGDIRPVKAKKADKESIVEVPEAKSSGKEEPVSPKEKKKGKKAASLSNKKQQTTEPVLKLKKKRRVEKSIDSSKKKRRGRDAVIESKKKRRDKKVVLESKKKRKGKKETVSLKKKQHSEDSSLRLKELSHFSQWLGTLSTPVLPIFSNDLAGKIIEPVAAIHPQNPDQATTNAPKDRLDPTVKKPRLKKNKKKKKAQRKSKKSKKRSYDSGVVLSDDIFSETLADLLASQGHYRQAIHMYEKMRLIYPEKSRFFAAKIEELNKKE